MAFVDMPADVNAFLAALPAALSDLSADPSLAERRMALKRLALEFGPHARGGAPAEARTIAHKRGAVPIRLYRPAAAEAGAPIVVHIHGGGWALGDFETYEGVCRAYCDASGAIVADVGYRLAPEHKFPAAFEDCVAAIEWAYANAAALGADPNRLIVTGDSAGGSLAACACLAANAPIALQVLLYPVIQVGEGLTLLSRAVFGGGERFLTNADIKRAEAEYLPSPRWAKDARVNALKARSYKHAPPALVVTAQFDPLRDEGLLFHTRLREAGVASRYWEAPGMIHGFVLFAGAIACGRDTIAAIGEEIRAARAQPSRTHPNPGARRTS